MRISTIASLALGSTTLLAQVAPTPLEQQCHDAVQGKIAWNQKGNTTWSEANVRDLCSGTTDPAATIACFQAGITANNAWKKDIAACKGPVVNSGQAPEAVRAAESGSGVNGHTATLVTFGSGGKRLGDYKQIGPGQWAEVGPLGHTRYRFQETNRDDWSVYLVDSSRGVRIQLDMYKRQVKYSEAGSTTPTSIYDVLSASSTGGDATVAAPTGPGIKHFHGDVQPTPAAGGQLDPSLVILRAGAISGDADAAAKCATLCGAYQGYSGRWAVAAPPDLGVCQCNAPPLPGVKANEIAPPQQIQSDNDAGRQCPTACQYYGGGDGTWRQLSSGTSVCGCAQSVQP